MVLQVHLHLKSLKINAIQMDGQKINILKKDSQVTQIHCYIPLMYARCVKQCHLHQVKDRFLLVYTKTKMPSSYPSLQYFVVKHVLKIKIVKLQCITALFVSGSLEVLTDELHVLIQTSFSNLRNFRLYRSKIRYHWQWENVKLKENVTVGNVLNPGDFDNIVRLNEGYRALKNLRGLPAYWESAKKDLFTLMRQLGIPTWCCSLSTAESTWTDLLKILGIG